MGKLVKKTRNKYRSKAGSEKDDLYKLKAKKRFQKLKEKK